MVASSILSPAQLCLICSLLQRAFSGQRGQHRPLLAEGVAKGHFLLRPFFTSVSRREGGGHRPPRAASIVLHMAAEISVTFRLLTACVLWCFFMGKWESWFALVMFS